jgi:hypothetical protein
VKKINIFTNTLSPRFQYISRFLCTDILKSEVFFFTDKNDYQNAEGVKINYSTEKFNHREIHILPEGLLFQTNIQPQPALEKIITDFFQGEKKDFDIFAASFYLLTRYEEYLPFEADAHDRFSAKKSLAYRLGFLQKPILHEWCEELRQHINQVFAAADGLEKRANHFCFQPTYDIDAAFAYKNKGFWRTIGALIKDVFNKKRWQVLLGSEKDPFDIFTYLDALHERHHLQPIYFFLLADWGKYDKNIAVQNTDFQLIIKNITRKYDTGIHPSYRSNDDFGVLEKEIKRLFFFKEKKVTKSRQHFLKLRFPTTYQRLLKAGIEEDFSMGYADAIGFRASVAIPFFWYDLENEQVTALKVHSFQVMDVTLKEYLALSPAQATEAMREIIANTKAVGGIFTSLWHNSSFGRDWNGWQTVYETMLAQNAPYFKKGH